MNKSFDVDLPEGSIPVLVCVAYVLDTGKVVGDRRVVQVHGSLRSLVDPESIDPQVMREARSAIELACRNSREKGKCR